MANTQRKVLIHGYYGAGNLGDDAILEAMISQISQLPRVGSITVSAYGTRRVYSGPYTVNTVAGRDVRALRDAVQACDVLVIGGGGLLHDYRGLSLGELLEEPPVAIASRSALGYYGMPLAMARFMGRPAMLYAVGVGPFRTSEGARLSGWLAQTATEVTVRDHASAELLRVQGVIGAVVTADPAVSLRPVTAHTSAATAALPGGGGSNRLTVGINLRPWSSGVGDYLSPTIEAARWLVSNWGASIAAMPLSVSRAEHRLAHVVHRSLSARNGGEVGAVVVPSTPSELLLACGRLDLVIAMRLHASVLSMVAGTPAVGLAYDPKVRQFYDEVGVPELCLDPAQLATGRLRVTVQRVVEDLPVWRDRVRKGLANLRDREQDNAAILGGLLEGERLNRGFCGAGGSEDR